MCERNGWNVVDIYEDVISGGSLDRPAFNQLLCNIQELRQHNTESEIYIVCDDVSRWSRSLEFMIEAQKAIDKIQALLVVNGRIYKPDESKLDLQVGVMMAENFRIMNKKRSMDSKRVRLLRWYRCYPAPFGYKYIRETGNGKILVLDRDYSDIIRQGFLLYYNKVCKSLEDVAGFYTDMWLHIPQRKADAHARSFGHARVWRMFANPLYAGYIHIPEQGIEWLEAQHEQTIPLHIYNEIQKIKEQRRTVLRNDNKECLSFFILHGKIETADWHPVYAARSKGKYKRYPYYKLGWGQRKNKSINANKLHKEFIAILENASFPEDLIAMIEDSATRQYEAMVAYQKTKKKSIVDTIDKIEWQIDNVVDAMALTSEIAVRERLEKKMTKLNAEKKHHESVLAAEKPVFDIKKILRIMRVLLCKPVELRQTLSSAGKDAYFSLVFEKKLKVNRSWFIFSNSDLSSPIAGLQRFFSENLRGADDETTERTHKTKTERVELIQALHISVQTFDYSYKKLLAKWEIDPIPEITLPKVNHGWTAATLRWESEVTKDSFF